MHPPIARICPQEQPIRMHCLVMACKAGLEEQAAEEGCLHGWSQETRCGGIPQQDLPPLNGVISEKDGDLGNGGVQACMH